MYSHSYILLPQGIKVEVVLYNIGVGLSRCSFRRTGHARAFTQWDERQSTVPTLFYCLINSEVIREIKVFTVMKQTFLLVLFLLIANIGFAQSNDFDRQLRKRFPHAGIPTDRRFDINNYAFPANEISDVHVCGKFMFLIYEESGVNMTGIEYERLVEAFKQATAIYDECIEIPYTVPIIVVLGKDTGCYASSLVSDNMEDTSSGKAVSKILRGDNDSYLQLWINSNLNMFISGILEDGYYTIKRGEGDSYLPMVIAHEIFHGLAQSYNILGNYVKSYGTICEREGHNYPKMHTHPSRTGGCYSELYYDGENAVKANGGFPIQSEQMHFCLVDNLIESISAGGLIDINKIYIWNHVGPVSLGLLQDVGYKVKEDYINSEYIQPYYGKPSWTILDKNGDYHGRIVLGKIQGLSPDCEEKYNSNELLEMEKLRPYLESRFNPTGNIQVENNEISVIGHKGEIKIFNVINNVSVTIFNVSGKMIKQKNEIHEDISISVPSGIYIVKVNEQIYKVICK